MCSKSSPPQCFLHSLHQLLLAVTGLCHVLLTSRSLIFLPTPPGLPAVVAILLEAEGLRHRISQGSS